MAIEILKVGVKAEAFWFGDCRECGTEVRFKSEDAVKVHSCQRGGDYAAVVCPICDSTIYAYTHRKVPV